MGNACANPGVTAAVEVITLPAKKTAQSPSVAIIYYSTYGHMKTMVDTAKTSLEGAGVSVDVFQVPETLPSGVLKALGAPPKPADVMTIDYNFLETLPQYDGFLFGFPTRFGTMCAQMKTFLDSTGGLWQSGGLKGKLVATLVSTGTQNGGQETTHFTALTNFVHHGMIYVPLGYQAGAEGQFDLTEPHGGSPYGGSTLAGGDGSRQPSEMELKIIRKQGQIFAAEVKRLGK